MARRIAVLMGGASAERDVSLMTGAKVMEALQARGHDVCALDPAETSAAFLERLRSVEVAFIALHGPGGEDGSTQGFLELLGVPYTGSGVLASALAINKVMSKRIFAQVGIPTPAGLSLVADRRDGPAAIAAACARVREELPLPVVVKPVDQGSTFGVTVVRDWAELPAAIECALAFGREFLVEAFVAGIEITAAVLGNDAPEVLPLVEIVPASGFYDYEAKYTAGATEEICPARLRPDQTARAQELALAAHRALGCRGVSRVDMIVGAEGLSVLEVNTIPGMTETSLVPCAAQAAGIAFPELVERIVELALEGRS
jgi:D-alanine-D-alanine ligase